MKPIATLNRRDFLKVLGATLGGSLTASMPGTLPSPSLHRQNPSGAASPNIIILLFDALSARHLSLYGYRRQTSPNLERFAQRAIVYHNHYAPGNFTTPSTASLLTGCYPWTHRALNMGSQVRRSLLPFNLFRYLSSHAYQCAFTQNSVADTLLYQLGAALDEHHRMDSFSLAGQAIYPFIGDSEAVNALYAYDRFQFKNQSASGSLFLALLRDISTQIKYRLLAPRYLSLYPPTNTSDLGGPDASLYLPCLINTDVYFVLSQLFDGVIGMLDATARSAAQVARPFLTYIHFLPPHSPYMPSARLLGSFADGWSPPPKPDSRLLGSLIPQSQLDAKRQRYDEFIADLDLEFGRLLDHLEQTGRLDDSIVVVTSDHGETFERGEAGHFTPNLYEQLIHIPLLISVPGQTSRGEATSLTSSLDLLPTLLKIAGVTPPAAAPLEGQTLPGFENWPHDPVASLAASAAQPERSVFVVEAKSCPSGRRIRDARATTALRKGRYKLIHYTQYPRTRERYEFFDLDNDPEELDNRYKSHPLAGEYQAELDRALLQAENRLFEGP